MARRAQGEGSVFYDNERKVWRGELDIGRNPKTGKRIRRKVSAPAKTECRSLLDDLRSQFKTSGTVPRRDTTVKQLVEDWLTHPAPNVRSPISKQVHGDAGKRIIAALGHVKAVRLTIQQ